jgi:DNA-binding GntR family transcriptional regulator
MESRVLNKWSPEPLYVQVQNWIKQNISNGTWKSNNKLPSESDLAEALDISRGTLKQAIKQLVDEGVLVQIHGKGTFVVVGEQLESPLAERLVSTAEALLENQKDFTTELVGIELIEAFKPVDESLGLTIGERLYALRRLRYLNQTPVVFLENYLSQKLFPELDRHDFTKETLFSIIENHYNKKIKWGKRSFVAKGSTKHISELLQIKKNTPIILLDQVLYSESNEPLEYSKVWIRSDQIKLTSVLKRD